MATIDCVVLARRIGKKREVSFVAALLKRWLIRTLHGAINHKNLPYYLDEFTFRFNRKTSYSRGKLFYRLIEQALAIDPVQQKH